MNIKNQEYNFNKEELSVLSYDILCFLYKIVKQTKDRTFLEIDLLDICNHFINAYFSVNRDKMDFSILTNYLDNSIMKFIETNYPAYKEEGFYKNEGYSEVRYAVYTAVLLELNLEGCIQRNGLNPEEDSKITMPDGICNLLQLDTEISDLPSSYCKYFEVKSITNSSFQVLINYNNHPILVELGIGFLAYLYWANLKGNAEQTLGVILKMLYDVTTQASYDADIANLNKLMQ